MPFPSTRSISVLAALAIASAVFSAPAQTAPGPDCTIMSPDGKVVATVKPGAQLSYTVSFCGQALMGPSRLGIIVNSVDLGQDTAQAGEAQTSEVNETYPSMGVHSQAVNHYDQAILPMTGSSAHIPWLLEVRVFDDGVAFRYRVPGEGTRHLNGESSEWNLPVGTLLWSQNADNRSYEARYVPGIVGQLPRELAIMAPATFKFPGGYGMMTEANLVNYSDMALQVEGENGFKALFHNDTQGWEATGEIVSPWRVTLLAADLNTLVNSDIVKNLCPPPATELTNAAWIRPGRSAWHYLTTGAPKLEAQKSWVDATHQMGFEYYLVDNGWRNWKGGGDNAWKALEEIVTYAKGQNVDIWAWVDSKYVFTSDDRLNYMQRAKNIGVVGLKIDYPHPANAQWVQWYEDTRRDGAAAQLLIDFHSSIKPTGRERTWPNEISCEAVCGRVQGRSPSSHNTAVPFVRYVQGVADYTPTLLSSNRLYGATYAQEVAMAVVYTSPFLCMGDHPSHYLDSEAADILKALPATWDETVVLPGSEIGEKAAFARRHGNQWFVGIINGTMPRRDSLSLSFLGEGNYKLIELADNRDRNDGFARTERTVNRSETLVVPLRRDGGYVAWLRRE